MGKRLVDVLDDKNKPRMMVLSKLKKLMLVIGPSTDASKLGDDWDFVTNLAECIQHDGSIPTKQELEHCNKLWRKYNVK
tara:strand:- start:142 stop:378 length:237 start_codon:yes stop_codon:yes gene_type:complete